MIVAFFFSFFASFFHLSTTTSKTSNKVCRPLSLFIGCGFGCVVALSLASGVCAAPTGGAGSDDGIDASSIVVLDLLPSSSVVRAQHRHPHHQQPSSRRHPHLYHTATSSSASRLTTSNSNSPVDEDEWQKQLEETQNERDFYTLIDAFDKEMTTEEGRRGSLHRFALIDENDDEGRQRDKSNENSGESMDEEDVSAEDDDDERPCLEIVRRNASVPNTIGRSTNEPVVIDATSRFDVAFCAGDEQTHVMLGETVNGEQQNHAHPHHSGHCAIDSKCTTLYGWQKAKISAASPPPLLRRPPHDAHHHHHHHLQQHQLPPPPPSTSSFGFTLLGRQQQRQHRDDDEAGSENFVDERMEEKVDGGEEEAEVLVPVGCTCMIGAALLRDENGEREERFVIIE